MIVLALLAWKKIPTGCKNDVSFEFDVYHSVVYIGYKI